MNTPTKITLSRIIAIVLMIIALVVFDVVCAFNNDFALAIKSASFAGINPVYFGVMIVFVLASCTDWLDGYLARKNNQVTDLGKFLDPVADKLLVNSTIIFLLIPHSYTENQMVFPLYCAILIVARDIVVDALRFIAANKKVVIAANIFGKAKTVLEMVAIPLVLLNGWPFSYFDISWVEPLRIANIFVYLATAVSLISGVIYLARNVKVFKESKVPELISFMKEMNKTFCSVESITCGGFANEIGSYSGASQVFKGGIVSYKEEIKEKLVGVKNETIENFTVVSKEVAMEMAIGGREKLGTDFCIACTGNAGPTVCEGNKPVGMVFVAFASENGCEVKELSLVGKRNEIRNKVVECMIDIIFDNIKKC